MATPNYGYEKRQRELEKKRKKAEKAQAKATRRNFADQLKAQDDAKGRNHGSQASIPMFLC